MSGYFHFLLSASTVYACIYALYLFYQVVGESGVADFWRITVHAFQPGTESSSRCHTSRPFISRAHSCCVELFVSSRLCFVFLMFFSYAVFFISQTSCNSTVLAVDLSVL